MFCPIYTCKLVRSANVRYSAAKVNTTTAAIDLAKRMLSDSPCEQFVAILLDTKLQIIGAHVVTVGTLDSSLVHPREAFRAAILANASAILFAHNHPSGDLTPSRQDIDITKRMRACGETLGINVLDHVIVSGDGGYSLAEHNQF